MKYHSEYEIHGIFRNESHDIAIKMHCTHHFQTLKRMLNIYFFDFVIESIVVKTKYYIQIFAYLS